MMVDSTSSLYRADLANMLAVTKLPDASVPEVVPVGSAKGKNDNPTKAGGRGGGRGRGRATSSSATQPE
eukprot:464508-Amphidinium_carterae.1